MVWLLLLHLRRPRLRMLMQQLPLGLQLRLLPLTRQCHKASQFTSEQAPLDHPLEGSTLHLKLESVQIVTMSAMTATAIAMTAVTMMAVTAALVPALASMHAFKGGVLAGCGSTTSMRRGWASRPSSCR